VPDPDARSAAPNAREAVRRKWLATGLLLAGLGLAGLTVGLGRSRVTSTKAAAAPSSGQVQFVLHLDTFVLNLADPEQKAYLRVGIDLGLKDKPGKPDEGDAGPPVALIRDTILGVLSLCQPDQVLTPEGKTKLKQDLLGALQQRAPGLGVQAVYFTEFLIQR